MADPSDEAQVMTVETSPSGAELQISAEEAAQAEAEKAQADRDAEVEAKNDRALEAVVSLVRFKLLNVEDEAKLDAEQRTAWDHFLDDQREHAFSDKERDSILKNAQFVIDNAKPSCNQGCVGRGVRRISGTWDICVCVRRRVVDGEDGRSTARVPGRQDPKVNEKEKKDRLAQAKVVLARAKQEQDAALLGFDQEISRIEAESADYFAERRWCAAEKKSAEGFELFYTEMVVEDRAMAETCQHAAEEAAETFGGLLMGVLELRGPASNQKERQATREAAEKLAATINESIFHNLERVDHHRSRASQNEERRLEHVAEIAVLDVEISALDAEKVQVVDRLETLGAERSRIARHHAPKIEKAESRVRRLSYIKGEAIE